MVNVLNLAVRFLDVIVILFVIKLVFQVFEAVDTEGVVLPVVDILLQTYILLIQKFLLGVVSRLVRLLSKLLRERDIYLGALWLGNIVD